MTSPQRIGIAVVEHRGRYLVGIRPPGVPLAGYAEFPGGKCEPGEAADVCAVRECAEETGLAVMTVHRLDQLVHRYDHGTIELHFWLCRPCDAATVADDHRGYGWVAARELATLQFPDANAGVIRMLSNRATEAQG
jgi:8-oxo-dGTP diphosphatase